MARARIAGQKYDQSTDSKIYDLWIRGGFAVNMLAARFNIDRATVRMAIKREKERRNHEV